MPNSDLIRGRKFSAEELQLLLLWLLRENSAHGYELIKRLAELSKGYYSPSPGVLYPALAQLAESGFAEVEQQGKRKSYQLTAAGLAHLQAQHQQAEVLVASLRHAAKRMQWLALSSQNEADASAATGWLPEFIQARQALRMALLAHSDSDHQEQRRVSEILRRTAAELLKVSQ